ncbi:MAG: hypothetical protein AB1847_21125 [bacterium]
MSKVSNDKITVSFTKDQWEDVISCLEAVDKAKKMINTGLLSAEGGSKYFLKMVMRIKSEVEKSSPQAEIINLNVFR